MSAPLVSSRIPLESFSKSVEESPHVCLKAGGRGCEYQGQPGLSKVLS